jgi:hypothetical protein
VGHGLGWTCTGRRGPHLGHPRLWMATPHCGSDRSPGAVRTPPGALRPIGLAEALAVAPVGSPELGMTGDVALRARRLRLDALRPYVQRLDARGRPWHWLHVDRLRAWPPEVAVERTLVARTGVDPVTFGTNAGAAAVSGRVGHCAFVP